MEGKKWAGCQKDVLTEADARLYERASGINRRIDDLLGRVVELEHREDEVKKGQGAVTEEVNRRTVAHEASRLVVRLANRSDELGVRLEILENAAKTPPNVISLCRTINELLARVACLELEAPKPAAEPPSMLEKICGNCRFSAFFPPKKSFAAPRCWKDACREGAENCKGISVSDPGCEHYMDKTLWTCPADRGWQCKHGREE